MISNRAHQTEYAIGRLQERIRLEHEQLRGLAPWSAGSETVRAHIRVLNAELRQLRAELRRIEAATSPPQS